MRILARGRAVGGLLLVGFAIAPVVPTTLSLARPRPAARQATSLRLALALLVVTSLAITGLATRWPTA